MNELPELVLDTIFRHLGAKDLARMACVSRAFRDAADRAWLHVGIAHQGAQGAVATWLSQKRRYARVVSLRCGRWVSFAPTVTFERLQTLTYACSRVDVRALHGLPPSLRVLTIHQLRCVPASWRLSLSALFRMLPQLEILRLAFDVASAWGSVHLRGGPPTLRILDLRGCPDVMVYAVPNGLRELRLHGREGAYFSAEAFAGLAHPLEWYTLETQGTRCYAESVPPAAQHLRLRNPSAVLEDHVWAALMAVRGAKSIAVEAALVYALAPAPPTLDTLTVAASQVIFEDRRPGTTRCTRCQVRVRGVLIATACCCTPA